MLTIFVILHIIFAGIWISLLPISIILQGMIKKAAGTSAELTLLGTMLKFGHNLGTTGSIGILITGGAITAMGQYHWFDFDGMLWLALKQCVWILSFIIAMAFLLPRSKAAGELLAKEQAGPNASKGASPELRAKFASAGMFGMILALLVLTNIILGESKLVF